MTIGRWLAWCRWLKIQSGIVSWVPAVKLVTMISSKESANASSAPASRAVRMTGQRHVAERLERVGAEVGGRLLERGRGAAQAGDDVVVDHHDAERGVADDDRERAQAEADAAERRVERDAGDDPRQRDRQDQGERDDVAAEEPVAVDRERRRACPGRRDAAVATDVAIDTTASRRRARAGCRRRRLNHCSESSSVIGHVWARSPLKAYSDDDRRSARTGRRWSAPVASRRPTRATAALHVTGPRTRRGGGP